MTSIRDYFVEMGSSAENEVDRCSDQADRLDRRRSAYASIESQFDQLAADGVIDKKEMSEILDRLRTEGLSTSQLQQLYQQLKASDGHVSGESLSRLGDELKNELGKADADAGDQMIGIGEQVKKLQFFIDTGYSGASDYDKKSHDTYMTIIKNMVA